MRLKHVVALCSLGILVSSCSTQGASASPVVPVKEQCLYAAITAFPKGDVTYSSVYQDSPACASTSEVDKVEIRVLIAMAGLRAIELFQETS